MKINLYQCFNHWTKFQNIWIYSDPHFSDVESYKFRGIINVLSNEEFDKAEVDFSYEEYLKCVTNQADEMQIRNINSKVGKKDVIIFLGDIGNIECIKKIKGYKVLIMGNHDKGASNYKRAKIFTPSQTFMNKWNIHNEEEYKKYHSKVIEDFGINHHETTDLIRDAWNEVKYIDNHLFDEVYEGPLMINDRVILSHEPIFPTIPFIYNIHGHVHNSLYKGDEHHMNCCAESIDYMPISLMTLLKSGLLKHIDSIHRETIDKATERKRNKRV